MNLFKTRKSGCTEGQRTSFSKGILEKTDLLKPVLNKILTAQGYCVEHDFLALLIWCYNILS